MISALLVCLVVSISDGDTLTVRCDWPDLQRQIRIHAIDAPERNQPFGQQARQSLDRLCWQAQARIQPLDIDQFGRTVAQVECHGRDAAAYQVRRGMAWASTRYAQGRADLAGLEARARAARKGLWADTDPSPPWQWRRRHGP
ncbi:thermonuclease family protein [Acidovorax sp. Be4]|uniref:Thermonuclease family protein n=1 Tax=Acidovorax bellezanensis TaxID=2976702 RepID=A0ABT2PSR1_9BURK|nr:thermonuclease family protein [Acidovorax sp. Be4]MCT9812242.1 thermonuclease family protein [Acidovorax sp. Be4]